MNYARECIIICKLLENSTIFLRYGIINKRSFALLWSLASYKLSNLIFRRKKKNVRFSTVRRCQKTKSIKIKFWAVFFYALSPNRILDSTFSILFLGWWSSTSVRYFIRYDIRFRRLNHHIRRTLATRNDSIFFFFEATPSFSYLLKVLWLLQEKTMFFDHLRVYFLQPWCWLMKKMLKH